MQGFRDLPVIEILEIAKGENLGRLRIERSKGAPQAVPQICSRRPSADRFRLCERSPALGLPGSDQIDRRIYGRSPQVALFALRNRGGGIPAEQPQEDGLQDILSVCGIPGNPVGSSEHQTVVSLETLAEVPGERRNRTLSYC